MNWLLFFLIFPHLKPAFFEASWPMVDTAFDVARVASFLVICFLLIKRKKMPSLVSWLIVALEAYLVLITVCHGGYIRNLAIFGMTVIAFCFIIDYYSQNMNKMCATLLLAFEIVVYIELISIPWFRDQYIVNPNVSMQHIYFLGHENNVFGYLAPAVLLALANAKLNGQRLRAAFLIVACYAIVFITFPASAAVAFAVMVGVALLFLLPGLRKPVLYPIYFLFTVAGSLAISVFHITERPGPLNWVIVNVLHKTPNLSNRTIVWDGFFKVMRGHYLFGLGASYEEWIYYPQYQKDFTNAHNEYFELLLTGGIPALLLLLAIIALIGVCIYRCKDTYMICIITIVMTGAYTAWIAENPIAIVYLLFPLAYHLLQNEEMTSAKLSCDSEQLSNEQ